MIGGEGACVIRDIGEGDRGGSRSMIARPSGLPSLTGGEGRIGIVGGRNETLGGGDGELEGPRRRGDPRLRLGDVDRGEIGRRRGDNGGPGERLREICTGTYAGTEVFFNPLASRTGSDGC